MSNRKAIPLKIQLAAALLQLVDDKGERLIPHEHAKCLSAEMIISLFHRDHYPIRVADGGTDEPHNLTWRLRAEHKVKTATIDQPQLAKQRRIRARELDHKMELQAMTSTDRVSIKPKRKFPSRPFPKGRRLIAF